MESKNEIMDALELLKWQLDLGVNENIGCVPLDRFSDHSQMDETKMKTLISQQQKKRRI